MIEAINTRVTDIQIQPLKGGAALSVEQVRMTKSGLETSDGKIKDHFLFAVTATPDQYGDHNFFTQRLQVDPKKNLYVAGTPELALARPEIKNEGLIYNFDGHDEIVVPNENEDDPTKILQVQLWEYRGGAVEVPTLSQWLSDMLHRNVLVARTSGPWNRISRQNFMINNNPLRAQDGYPVHVVTEEDVKAVFAAIGASPIANRFRYQFLLEGMPFRGIHNYVEGEINGITVKQPKPCGRCEQTGFDQIEGKFSPIKPLAGLTRLGVGRWIRPDGKKDHIMGENWLPQGETIISRGDIFTFTKSRETALEFEKPKSRN